VSHASKRLLSIESSFNRYIGSNEMALVESYRKTTCEVLKPEREVA
jgi:hypothetical protein